MDQAPCAKGGGGRTSEGFRSDPRAKIRRVSDSLANCASRNSTRERGQAPKNPSKTGRLGHGTRSRYDGGVQGLPWTRGTTVALAVVLLGALATLLWRVDPYFHVRVDAAIYLLTAKSLLGGDGYTYLGDTFALRPPGFPLLLAPILAVFGTNFTALNLWVSLFAVAAIGLLFIHGTRRVGPLVAAAAAALVWLNPTFTKTSFEILSDVPSVTLLMLSVVVETWAMRRPSTRRDVVVGVCIAGAAYVRTTNVLLALAFVLARALHLPANERRKPGPHARRPALVRGEVEIGRAHV